MTKKELCKLIDSGKAIEARLAIFEFMQEHLYDPAIWESVALRGLEEGQASRTLVYKLKGYWTMISGLHATPIKNRCPPASPELATRLPSPITAYTPNAGMRGRWRAGAIPTINNQQS